MRQPERSAAGLLSLPNRFGLCAGAAAVAVAAVAAGALPAAHAPLRPVVVAIAVGCCAAAHADIQVTLVVATFGYLVTLGLGSSVDPGSPWAQAAWNLVLLSGAVGLGLGQRWMCSVRKDIDAGWPAAQQTDAAD
jgi:hypothetical protein